jgi:hypothetical protein
MGQQGGVCANCGTERFPLHAKGYCKDCYDLIRRRNQVKAWDVENPATLKSFPKGGYMGTGDNPNFIRGHFRRRLETDLPEIKAKTLKEIDQRLRLIKVREIELVGPIDGMTIERTLRNLAKRAGAKNRNVLYGIASEANDRFDAEGRQRLFRWLNEIEESAPWGRGRRRRRFTLA